MTAIQQGVRTFCVAAIAFFCYLYFKLVDGYWLVLTSILLVQINPNNFFWRNLISPFVCGILIASTVFLIYLLGSHYLVLTGLVFIVTFLCVSIGLIKSELFLPAMLINLLIIMALGTPMRFEDMLMRIQWIVLGSLLAMLMKILLGPPGVKRHWREQVANYLQAINQLQKYFFWIYVARNYLDKAFFYEKELHKQRLCVLKYIENIKLLNIASFEFEKLFEITLALGDMRYRVKDFTTFEMSEKEFIAISNSLNDLFNQAAKQLLLGKKINLDCSQLISAIAALEDITRGTLQIASAEPVVFVIFIQYLRALSDEINAIPENLEKIRGVK